MVIMVYIVVTTLYKNFIILGARIPYSKRGTDQGDSFRKAPEEGKVTAYVYVVMYKGLQDHR